MKKTCSSCKEDKNEGEYSRDKSRKDGRCASCKTCRRQYRVDNAIALAEQRKRYKATPEGRYGTYKDSAKHRGYTWSLSFADFRTFWQLPCVWCGVDIATIGLDRVDPSVPYQLDNIEPCCSDCNRMKSDLTSDEFENHINKIATFR